MDPFTEISLFSGAGGGLLGTTHLLGWRTVCYVEWDKYAVEVLKARIRDGYLHDAPIWDDAFTFDGRPWAGLVDVVTAGFPCQPFSVAGKGLAEHDPRNGWPAVIRILREVRPRYALLENVAGLLSKPYIRRILGDLAEAGFDIEHDCITAAEVGANHKRERLWFIAHAQGGARDLSEELDVPDATIKGLEGSEPEGNTLTDGRPAQFRGEVADTHSLLLGERGEQDDPARPRGQRDDLGGREAQDVSGAWWAVEPELGRVADGVAHRVDRLRAIGNGQVPAVVREAWNRLSERK